MRRLPGPSRYQVGDCRWRGRPVVSHDGTPCPVGYWLYAARRTCPESRRHRNLLETQFPRAVVPEQVAVPDIPTNHLNRAVSGLVHDGPFRRTCDSCGGGVSGPERVPGILGSVQTGTLRELLDDPSHVDTGQPTCFYMPMAI